MKIERTYLYSSDMAENMQNLYDYLLENAVPEYFDSVTISENKFTISCYIGEKVFLKFESGANWSDYRMTVTALNSVTSTIGYGSTGSYSSTPGKVTYAYKCGNSISFCFTSSSGDILNNEIKITITRDNAGNTALVWLNDKSIVQNAANTIYTSDMSSKILSVSMNVNSNGQLLTAKVPFFVGSSGNYTSDVFLMPYTEYSAKGIIEMDGVHYVSNGLWCCKE